MARSLSHRLPAPRRRQLLRVLGTAPLLAAAAPVHALLAPARTLSFSHIHTGERATLTYFDAGHYVPEALDAVSRLLRDFRTGTVFPMDVSLLDFVHTVQTITGSRAPIEIISGYRSPATNEMLRQTTSGVAKDSFHMRGRALDIRLTDVASSRARDAAKAAGLGGVGYYPESNFVHLDTGPVRAW